MVAIKNQIRGVGIFLLTGMLFLAGCTPPGPRALLEGQSLIEKGRYDEAIARLKTATTLLETNAQAWNYLGLAYHHAGQATNAVTAYQQALKLNHNLTEAHYNLGCLWLEQNKLDAAKTEFNAVTLRRDNSAEGWTKLGAVQWRLRDFTSAEASFNKARQLNPQNPEALNGLGLLAMQRNRPRDAAQFFSGALQVQPNYGPALLNLAVVSHAYLNDRPLALQKYREYLALTPTPPNAEAVNATARALEQQLAPAIRPVATNAVVQAGPYGDSPKPATNVIAAIQPKTETPTNVTKPTTPVHSTVSIPAERATPPLVVRTNNVSTSAVATAASPGPLLVEQPKPPAKTGFLQRLNPFRRKEDKPPTVTPLPPTNTISAVVSPTNPTAPPPKIVSPPPAPAPAPPVIARFKYRLPAKPAAGNRVTAEVPFVKGNQAYQARRFAEAAQAYLEAAQLDPAYFNAQYYLGLAAGQAGNLGQSLWAYENALAIQPDSADARYAFAQALKQANYPVDAANELERILADNPRDVRAHLAAGSIYAQQLQQPARARGHYLKVLEYDPTNAQATAIRFWLVDHPL